MLGQLELLHAENAEGRTLNMLREEDCPAGMAKPMEVAGVSRPSRSDKMARAAEVRVTSRLGISRGMSRAAQMAGMSKAGVHKQMAALQDLDVTLWVPRCFS